MVQSLLGERAAKVRRERKRPSFDAPENLSDSDVEVMGKAHDPGECEIDLSGFNSCDLKRRDAAGAAEFRWRNSLLAS